MIYDNDISLSFILFDVNTHPTSLHASIQIIITKNEFKWQCAKLIQF